MSTTQPLTHFARLAIAAAVATIGLKAAAYLLTGSVSLLSDALESLVTLVAAIIALIALTVAMKEPDEEHAYGHAKAEYFASGLEGGLVLLAAVSIILTAVPRLFQPEPIEQVGWGTAVSVVATLINLAVARRLFQAGTEHRSVTLEADARHLMADVWTSVGVIAGVITVSLTGWERIDPIIALAVAGNIVWTGISLVRRSMHGLLDTAIVTGELAAVEGILSRYEREVGIQTHALRTRQAGMRRFVSVHILVPGGWSVRDGHRLLEEIENDIRTALPGTTVFTHLEPLDDPVSWQDTRLDRDAMPTEAPGDEPRRAVRPPSSA